MLMTWLDMDPDHGDGPGDDVGIDGDDYDDGGDEYKQNILNLSWECIYSNNKYRWSNCDIIVLPAKEISVYFSAL